MSKQVHILIALSMLLAACGGGGGGSVASTGGQVNPVVTSSGNVRQITADCSFTQNLGAARLDGLRIDSVRWLQTVAQDPEQSSTRLVAGKAVKVRVDVLANSIVSSPATRKLRVYDPGTSSCTDYILSGPSSVPVSSNVDTLTTAYTATLPASAVKPGMSVAIFLDDASGRSATEADQTYRYYQPTVVPAVTEQIRLIPITFAGSTGYVGSTTDVARLLERLMPVSQALVTTEAPFTPTLLTLASLLSVGSVNVGSLTNMQTLLSELDDHCASLNGSQASARTAPKCIGVFPDNLVFKQLLSSSSQYVGLGYVGGIALIAQSVPVIEQSGVNSPYDSNHWLTYRATTIAHEFGHLLNLNHGNCGGATGIDPRLYSDGRLGSGAGYDSYRDFYFSATRTSGGVSQFADLMSYCGKEWMSDKGWQAALGYRAGAANVAAREVVDARWLKISRTPDGSWRLRPVDFAPGSLRDSDYSLDVTSASGSESLPLQSAVTSDSDDQLQGPYYVNLGSRQVALARLIRAGAQLMQWQQGDLAK